jgi:hypothetical protein
MSRLCTFEAVRIVVNHVTRMTGPRICVAGIDTATYRHVRPVTPPDDLLTRVLLRENGGPFGAGALVDIGRATACPDAPETEDHRFDKNRAQRVNDVDDEAYLELLGAICQPDVRAAFGSALVEVRPCKFAVPAGCGECSLAVVSVLAPELRISSGRLYLRLNLPATQADLRVTDVRFYTVDLTIKRDVVKDVNRRLAAGTWAYAMLGLARAIRDDATGQELHWLMANGLCLVDRAVGDMP